MFCAKQNPCQVFLNVFLYFLLCFVHNYPELINQGRLFDCGFYDADAWVCMSENQNQRKYDWIEYEDGTRLGRKTTCPSKRKIIINFFTNVLLILRN